MRWVVLVFSKLNFCFCQTLWLNSTTFKFNACFQEKKEDKERKKERSPTALFTLFSSNTQQHFSSQFCWRAVNNNSQLCSPVEQRKSVISRSRKMCNIRNTCLYIKLEKLKKLHIYVYANDLNQMFLFVHDCIIIRLCLLYLFFKDLHTVFTYLSLKTPNPGGAVSHTQLLHM